MIRWCAYCQRYQGAVEPFDDYSLTHTICEACFSQGAYKSGQGADLRPVRDFFARLAYSGLGRLPSAAEVIEEGSALGIDPIDLLLGVVQPVLQQIGQRWNRSEITVAEEHRITALCAAVIESIASKDPNVLSLRSAPRPDVLLVAAEGNFHTVGVQLVEVLLLRARVSVYTVYPGIPTDEIVRLAHMLSPKVIAISIALPTQLSSAMSVAKTIAAWPENERPLLALGGRAILDAPITQDAGLFLCQDTHALLALLGRGQATAAPGAEGQALLRAWGCGRSRRVFWKPEGLPRTKHLTLPKGSLRSRRRGRAQ